MINNIGYQLREGGGGDASPISENSFLFGHAVGRWRVNPYRPGNFGHLRHLGSFSIERSGAFLAGNMFVWFC